MTQSSDPKLFLLFNHQVTSDQVGDAHLSLAVSEVVEPPEKIKAIWKCVPPELSEIERYLAPVKAWLTEEAGAWDYLLVQGDFGATYLMVCFAFERGLIPVYSTTERQVKETRSSEGTVNTTHVFKHVQFRKYGS